MSERPTDEQVAEALRDVKQCLNPDYVSQAFIQVSADLSAAEEEHYECVRIASERLGRQLNPERTRDAVVALINALDESQADLSAAKEARDADVQDATRGYAECESRLIDATQRLRTAEAALSALQEAAREAVEALGLHPYGCDKHLPYVCKVCGGEPEDHFDLDARRASALSSLRAHLPEAGR